jgi:hypothetical protein
MRARPVGRQIVGVRTRPVRLRRAPCPGETVTTTFERCCPDEIEVGRAIPIARRVRSVLFRHDSRVADIEVFGLQDRDGMPSNGTQLARHDAGWGSWGPWAHPRLDLFGKRERVGCRRQRSGGEHATNAGETGDEVEAWIVDAAMTLLAERARSARGNQSDGNGASSESAARERSNWLTRQIDRGRGVRTPSR